MSSLINSLPQLDQVASLAGLFNWELSDGNYKNPNGNTTWFYIVNVASILPGLQGTSQIPVEQYIGGAVSTYNLINGSDADTNLGLFNTTLAAKGIRERITRKHTVNRVPYANYDQPVDLGTGTQRIEIRIVLVGTQYLKAYYSIVQSLFDNTVSGLGTLTHPIYGVVNNVLPIDMGISFEDNKLNCVVCNIVFHTSDISHLNPQSLTNSNLATIGTYFAGANTAISTLQTSLNTLKGAPGGINLL